MINKRKEIENYVQSIYLSKGYIGGHGLDHSQRVWKWAKKIATALDFEETECLHMACFFHDIGLTENNKKDHGKESAYMARKFLNGVDYFTSRQKSSIVKAIELHNTIKKGSLLLNILRDADRLDMLGIIGIMRTCVYQNNLKLFDPKKPRGETWGYSSDQFDDFYRGKKKFKTIVDVLNFQISQNELLDTLEAKLIGQGLMRKIQNFIIELDFEFNP